MFVLLFEVGGLYYGMIAHTIKGNRVSIEIFN